MRNSKAGLISLPILLASQGVWAQDTALVVSTCNLTQFGWLVGQQRPFTQDLTGAACTNAGTPVLTVPNPLTVIGTVSVSNFPNPLTVTGAAGGSGLIQQDATAFTPTTTSFVTGGGFFQTTPTNNTLANLQMGGFQVTNTRELFTNLRNAGATEIGTAANPVSTVGTVTVNNASLTVSVSNIATSVTVNNATLAVTVPNPVSVTLVSGLPNPVTITGAITLTSGTVTIANNPLIASISNFPNPVTIVSLQQDATSFTPTTTSIFVGGGFFQTTPSNNTLTNLQMGGFQVTNTHELFTNLRNAAATEIGTAANPVSTVGTTTINNASIAVTVPNPTTVTVAGITVSVMPNPTTVAGTITVNNSPLVTSMANWSGFPNPISASVQGFAVDSTTATGNPVLVGGVASTSEPTAATNLQAVQLLATVTKKLVNQPFATPEEYTYGTVSTGSTTAVTVIASPGASLRLYGWVECGRNDAGTAAVTVTLNDVAGSVMVVPNTSGGGGNNFAPPIPLQWGVNSAITIAVSTATTTMFCNAQAFKSAI